MQVPIQHRNFPHWSNHDYSQWTRYLQASCFFCPRSFSNCLENKSVSQNLYQIRNRAVFRGSNSSLFRVSSPRPVYFRSRKLHPISYPPSPFHSPRFISSSDPVPSPCCLCFPAANLETRICIILDFGNFGNDRGITESCACGLWSY